MNTCTFIGTVSDEPKRGTTRGGKPMLHFTLHVRYGTGDFVKTVFVHFQAFGRIVDDVPHLAKGSLCSVVADYGSYKTDAGEWRGIFTARELAILDHAPQHKSQPTRKPEARPPAKAGYEGGNDGFADLDDDCPF